MDGRKRARKKAAFAVPTTELFASIAPPPRKAVPSFLVSLGIHTAVVAAIWIINPHTTARQFKLPTVDELVDQEDRRIVWYAPEEELPEVAPVDPPKVENPAEKPRYELPQEITADQPNPQSDVQMILSDAPEIVIEQDVDMANVFSWEAPKVEAPRFEPVAPKLVAPSRKALEEQTAPKVDLMAELGLDPDVLQQTPTLRFQSEQKAEAAPDQKALEADAAPQVAAQTNVAFDPSQFQELARLRYHAQASAPQSSPEARALEAEQAPVIGQTPETRPGLNAAEFQQLSRLRYQSGGETPKPTTPERRALIAAGGPAPTIGPTGAPPPSVGGIQDEPRLRYQGFAGRPGVSAPRPRAATAVGAAPAITASAEAGSRKASDLIAKAQAPSMPSLGAGGDRPGGTGGDRNLVVVSANPSRRTPDTLPVGSRRGSFSAGPTGGPGGGVVGSNNGRDANLRAPNLSIKSTGQGKSTGKGKSIADDLRDLLGSGSYRDRLPAPDLEVAFDPRQINLEKPFVGRPVYTLAINMPNVTSYRGDWVIQFAEMEDDAKLDDEVEERVKTQQEGLTAPYPVVKVDPKYIVEAARERIQGEVVFYGLIHADGSLTGLTLVKGLDERLDAAAEEALRKWRFEPARKKETAVGVEALVRIPFRLDPGVKVLY